MNIDLAVFSFIHGQAKKSKALDTFAVFCAEYAGYFFVAFLLVIALGRRDWQLFLVPVFVGLFSRFILAEGIYLFYQRKRPLEVLPAAALIKKPRHPAFPSGHASFFFAFSFALFLFNVPLAIAAVIISCLVTLSRIFCGVHWPSDILAGFVMAGVSFLIFQQLV
jgi:undecaprenyl-diphosphatase